MISDYLMYSQVPNKILLQIKNLTNVNLLEF